MSDIEIKYLTKKELKVSLEQNTYWNKHKKVVPFAKNKAKWLLKNERIEDSDLCAVLALNEQRLIAMVNFIPDWINSPKGISKIYWSQRWWVHKDYKETVLPTYINQLSAEIVKNKVVIKYIGAETIPYYKKQPYIEFSNRTRYIFVFDIDAGLVINKLPILKKLKPFLNLIKKGSYLSIAKVNKLKLKTKGVSCRYVSTINENDWAFIKQYTKSDLVPKSVSYINWQLDNSQYTDPDSLETKQECLITSISKKIYNKNFFVVKGGKNIGFISVLIRANEYILRYFLCNSTNYLTCMDMLMFNFIDSKCCFLLTENVNLGARLNKRFLSVYCNKTDLVALAHKDLSIDFENLTINEQDGHFS